MQYAVCSFRNVLIGRVVTEIVAVLSTRLSAKSDTSFVATTDMRYRVLGIRSKRV